MKTSDKWRYIKRAYGSTNGKNSLDLSKKQKKDARIFKRDGWKCLRCGVKRDLTIDHVIPLGHGGSNLPHNKQTLCYKCNQMKGVNEFDYRRIEAKKQKDP